MKVFPLPSASASCRGTAGWLARLGFWPTILYPIGHHAKGGPTAEDGKRPIGANWGARRLGPEDVAKRFDEYPGAGVGIGLGPGRGPGGRQLIDIEVDERVTGKSSLLLLFGGELVDSMGWESARGAHRLFFADGERVRKIVGRVGVGGHIPELPGVELRGLAVGQHQSVCPPTITDGVTRQWNGVSVVAELPEVAYRFLERLARPVDLSRANQRKPPRDHAGRLGDGDTPYGLKALGAECERVAGAAEGERHNALRVAGLKTASLTRAGLLDEGRRRESLAGAASQCGLPESESQGVIRWTSEKAGPRVLPGPVGRESGTAAGTGHGNDIHGLPSYDIHGPPPKEEPCMSFSGSAQPCMSLLDRGDPQPCMSVLDKVGPQPCMSVLDEKTRAVIQKHAFSGQESEPFWRGLFDLRRELDQVAMQNCRSTGEWKAVVAYWLNTSRGLGAELPGFDSVWAEFKKKLNIDLTVPHGSALDCARQRMPDVSIPQDLKGGKLEAVFRVMSALAEVERQGAAFYASCYLIAGLASVKSPKTVHRYLGALCKMGYLSLVQAGTPGTGRNRKANEYQWYDPPRPGRTSWNSAKRGGPASVPSSDSDWMDW